jgi:hypothetical protein
LLNPIRLTIAPVTGSRNNRGRGFPGWACSVTVPTSTNPKPSAGHARSATPFLSMPAASPTGFGKSTPNTVTGARGARLTRPTTLSVRSIRSVRSWAVSASMRNRTRRAAR